MNSIEQYQEPKPEKLRKKIEAIYESHTAAAELQELFAEHNIETEEVLIDNNVFERALVFPHNYQGTEPLVRIYRGINQLDETLLNQVPYALRTREKDAETISVLDHARAEVDALTAEPTYENLLRYVDAVWPDLSDDEIGRFARSLADMEDSVMNDGISLRRCLVHETFKFGGGVYTDTGIAPYISASNKMREAAGYGGRGGFMILDVPLSKIEAITGKNDGEVTVKGAIPPEYISALVIKTRGNHEDSEAGLANELAKVAETLAPHIKHQVLDRRQTLESYSKLQEKEGEVDKANYQRDVEMIQARRAKLVGAKWPDLLPDGVKVKAIMEADKIDIYTATKRAIYDQLMDRYAKTGGHPSNFEGDYVFDKGINRETGDYEDIKYSRSNITDAMLEKIRKIVIYNEERVENWRLYDEALKLAR